MLCALQCGTAQERPLQKMFVDLGAAVYARAPIDGRPCRPATPTKPIGAL